MFKRREMYIIDLIEESLSGTEKGIKHKRYDTIEFWKHTSKAIYILFISIILINKNKFKIYSLQMILCILCCDA